MDDIQEIDTVLHHVRQAMRRLHIPTDATFTQQILLLGDSFYGYRFTAKNFTAVWSAADHVLKVFDAGGKALETFPVTEYTEKTAAETFPWTPQLRAA